MIRNMFSRVSGATALGAATTALVLWLMQSLIESDHAVPDEAPPGPTISFLPLIDEQGPRPRPDLPNPPPPPVAPPDVPPPAQQDTVGPVIGTEFTRPPVAVPKGPGSLGLVDGDALPVVKVRPVYPDNAARRGIEGQVLVQFTIDELGRVVDVTVLDAQPRGVFERAAVHAVERFRYKPRVVNGSATPVSGVQHLVTFRLDA